MSECAVCLDLLVADARDVTVTDAVADVIFGAFCGTVTDAGKLAVKQR